MPLPGQRLLRERTRVCDPDLMRVLELPRTAPLGRHALGDLGGDLRVGFDEARVNPPRVLYVVGLGVVVDGVDRVVSHPQRVGLCALAPCRPLFPIERRLVPVAQLPAPQLYAAVVVPKFVAHLLV